VVVLVVMEEVEMEGVPMALPLAAEEAVGDTGVLQEACITLLAWGALSHRDIQ
jgi:hypothetical protein